MFTGNSASFAAGLRIGWGVTATITASSFTGNTAHAWAGGLWNEGATTVANSTFSGNSSGTSGDFGWGAGILHIGGSLALTNATVVSNTAANWAGGIGIWASLTVAITNSIVADNGPENCRTNGRGVPVVSGGSNIENANTCDFTAASDHPNTPTGLQGTPTDNGGPVTTLAPLPGSAARAAGDDARCAAPPGGAGGVDQRGVPRPQAAHSPSARSRDQPVVAISFTPAVSPPSPNRSRSTVMVAPQHGAGGGHPTGSVTLVHGAATVGPASLDSTGTATFSLPAQPAGSSAFTASFVATNGFFDATTAAASTITVKAPGRPRSARHPPASPSVHGHADRGCHGRPRTRGRTASTAGTTPAVGGTATFLDGSRLLGSAGVAAGRAVLTTSGLGAGSHRSG